MVGAGYYSTKIAYYNKTRQFDLQSSFVLRPYQGDNPKKNCEEERIVPTTAPPLTKPPVVVQHCKSFNLFIIIVF